jgi:hypothetical protein
MKSAQLIIFSNRKNGMMCAFESSKFIAYLFKRTNSFFSVLSSHPPLSLFAQSALELLPHAWTWVNVHSTCNHNTTNHDTRSGGRVSSMREPAARLVAHDTCEPGHGVPAFA